MRLATVGAGLLVVGVLAMLGGGLSAESVAALVERVLPVLAFVVAITVVAELAAEAGLFRFLAASGARLGRGRGWVLWLSIVALATACTVFLSLDTTAVLLTPIVILLARQTGLDPMPFALTTIWLANTGSLLLPVSNLTNLLALHALGDPSPASFIALTAGPAIVAVVVPCVILLLLYRRALVVRYRTTKVAPARDRVLFVASAIAVTALVPALVSGIEPWLPATIAALVLLVVTALRRPRVLALGLVPWSLLLFAAGLFLVVEVAHEAGLTDLALAVAGTGSDPLSLLQVAGAGLAAANTVNNLPAYLALEPIATDPARLVALLIGVNAGPLVTPWASLATLLWHQRLVALGVELSWGRFILLGALVAPVTVALATLALATLR